MFDDFVVDIQENSIIPIIEDAMSNENAFGMKRNTSDLPSNSTLGKWAAENEGREFFIDIPMEDVKFDAPVFDEPKHDDFMEVPWSKSFEVKDTRAEMTEDQDLFPTKSDR